MPNETVIKDLFKRTYGIFINPDFSSLSEKELINIVLLVVRQYANNNKIDFEKIIKEL